MALANKPLGAARREKCKPTGLRTIAVYDGRVRHGTVRLDESIQEASAWDSVGRFLGKYSSMEAAKDALAAGEQQAAEARRQLANLKPPFVTGLPDNL